MQWLPKKTPNLPKVLAFFLSCEKLYLLKWKSRWLGKANTIGLSIARAPGGIKTEEALKSTNSGGISVPLKGFDHPPEKEFIFLPDVTWGHHTAGTNSSRRFLKHLDSNSMVQVLRKPTRKSFLLDSFCIKRYRNMGWFMWNQSRAGKKKRKSPQKQQQQYKTNQKKKNHQQNLKWKWNFLKCNRKLLKGTYVSFVR